MNKIILLAVVDLLILGVAYLHCEGAYYGSFEHATYGGQNRLPLWYPYEICEMDDCEGQAKLWDWRYYPHSDPDLNDSYVAPLAVDYERARASVQEIVDFKVGSNVVCGLRELKRFNPRGFPQGKSIGELYFLFATNMSAVQYFSQESEFLTACRRYGVDGRERMNFHLNYGLFNRDTAEYETARRTKDRSYERARETFGLRLPLWYPYEILKREGRAGGTVELHDWRNYSHEETGKFWPLAAEIEESLLVLENIVDFKVHPNCVCGRREVRLAERLGCSRSQKLGERYFLFATNSPTVKYFNRESDYLAECRRFGVDGNDRADFKTNHREFMRKEGQTRLRDRVEFVSGQGPLGRKPFKFWLCVLVGVNLMVVVWSCRKRQTN